MKYSLVQRPQKLERVQVNPGQTLYVDVEIENGAQARFSYLLLGYIGRYTSPNNFEAKASAARYYPYFDIGTKIAFRLSYSIDESYLGFYDMRYEFYWGPYGTEPPLDSAHRLQTINEMGAIYAPGFPI